MKLLANEIYDEYLEGINYKHHINLFDDVEKNNNFYNDKQWEGVVAPSLLKPVFNIVKPSVNYYLAQIVSDNIGVNICADRGATVEKLKQVEEILEAEIGATLKSTATTTKNRQLIKNMALDGDMCLYSYFKPSLNGFGNIATEIINNTNVFFGNVISNDVEEQPYIMISSSRLLDEIQEEANFNGFDGDSIQADDIEMAEISGTSNYVTVLTKFYKEDGVVWFVRSTATTLIRKPTCLNYSLYPISFTSWETQKNSYHGISPITGKRANQIFINQLYALSLEYTKNNSVPKVLYNKTKLPQGWNNDASNAIGVPGDPKDALFSSFRAYDMSSQVINLADSTIARTKDSLGVYDSALGNVDPDNTSAIVAVQKAAAMPLDLQKMDFYKFMEDTINIWLEIMENHYGLREIVLDDGETVNFSFASLGDVDYRLEVEIGASTYWSELMQIQTIDNLMTRNIIPDAKTYLQMLPEGLIKNKGTLIKKIDEYNAELEAKTLATTQENLIEK